MRERRRRDRFSQTGRTNDSSKDATDRAHTVEVVARGRCPMSFMVAGFGQIYESRR
jgi:hypothetical protein